jgi:hypothetical protein
MSSLPYVPYSGTAGWSGTSTSKARAVDNVDSGRELNNQEKALAYLKKRSVIGATWKQLANDMDWHHGTASGVLSVLHQSGAIIRLTIVHEGCKVYVHQNFKDAVADKIEPYIKRTKACPNCGHES